MAGAVKRAFQRGIARQKRARFDYMEYSRVDSVPICLGVISLKLEFSQGKGQFSVVEEALVKAVHEVSVCVEWRFFCFVQPKFGRFAG